MVVFYGYYYNSVLSLKNHSAVKHRIDVKNIISGVTAKQPQQQKHYERHFFHRH